MPDPKALKQFPPGVKLGPIAVDDLPADWGEMADAGTPYMPVVLRHSDLTTVAVIRWVASATGTLASGYGNNYGNDFGGPP